MDAKKKAEQLVNDMQSSLYSDGWEDAKECAQIAAFEVLEALKKVKTIEGLSDILLFWYNVHNEIGKL